MTVSGRAQPLEDERAFVGLREQAAMLARGDVSSLELVERSLERIAATGATLNAFRCVRSEGARRDAEEADRRMSAGERLPLLGVPVAIKDEFDLEGETTAFGCAGSFAVARADCESARRLKASGAVIVGKTTTPELGQWPITEGASFGITRNPWSLEHTPGGSSGGSSAAVAAGLVAGALGADGLGSVRIPAAWSHLVGLKPQRGRISTWPEVGAFNGLSCIGPLGRTVADVATLLDAAAGNVPGDVHRAPPPAEPYEVTAQRADPGRPLRIALVLRIPFSAAPKRLDAGVRAATERIAGVLAGLGHEVDRADLPYGLWGLGAVVRSHAGARVWGRRIAEPGLLDARTRQNMAFGWFLSGPVLRLALAAERPMRRQIGPIFKRFDVVLTPTTAQPPLAVGSIDGLSNWETDQVVAGACPYTWPWNVLGWPGLNVPAGFNDAGLPLGAQLLGPANSEPLLFALAAQLEQQERWYERRPPVALSQQQDAV